jgi:hypothetical protein
MKSKKAQDKGICQQKSISLSPFCPRFYLHFSEAGGKVAADGSRVPIDGERAV